jgi:hypothetical protein
VTNSEVLPNVKLGMAPLYSFGLTSGMTTSCKLNIHGYSPLQRIRLSQLHSSCQTTHWRLSSISRSQSKPIKNFKICEIISKRYKYLIIQKTLGTTFGGTKLILQQSSITSPSNIYSLLRLLSGFGRPDARINSGCLPGFS